MFNYRNVISGDVNYLEVVKETRRRFKVDSAGCIICGIKLKMRKYR